MHPVPRGWRARPTAGRLSFSYPDAQRPPIGSALSRELAVRCGFEKQLPNEDPGNLQRVALAYEIEFGRERLVHAVNEAVGFQKQPSPALRRLPSWTSLS